jgi:hypothetical protein
MNCQAVETGNIAERYVLCALSEPERDAFEQHYYTCSRCFEEVQVLQALRKPAPRARRNPAGRRFLWLGAVAAAVALAVIGTGSRMWRGAAPKGVAMREGASSARERTLQLLARVEPPPYTATTLRGSEDTSDRRFRAAMARYTQGDYAAAANGLKEMLTGAADGAGPRFYLGVCDLLTGQMDDAVTQFRRVETFGETPYLEPGRFYLAKALLAKRDLAEAQRALVLTTELAGDKEAEARRLLEQVRALQPPK